MNDNFLGFGPVHWGLGLLMWLVIIVAFIALYIAIRKKSRHEGKFNAQPKTPLQQLQERLAKGEINDDEYADQKHKLEQP